MRILLALALFGIHAGAQTVPLDDTLGQWNLEQLQRNTITLHYYNAQGGFVTQMFKLPTEGQILANQAIQSGIMIGVAGAMLGIEAYEDHHDGYQGTDKSYKDAFKHCLQRSTGFSFRQGKEVKRQCEGLAASEFPQR
jgi:hypothetical protein